MKKSELLKISNQILENKKCIYAFSSIKLIPVKSLINRNDIFTLGNIDNIELWFSSKDYIENFLFTGEKLYELK